MLPEWQEPRCGFSRQAVSLLTRNAITFDSFDILSDNTVRQGLKKFSNWPTYPQVLTTVVGSSARHLTTLLSIASATAVREGPADRRIGHPEADGGRC